LGRGGWRLRGERGREIGWGYTAVYYALLVHGKEY
jgi:hypothetical protein